jgi:malto-oligosyltrehalose trehalohydrolase
MEIEMEAVPHREAHRFLGAHPLGPTRTRFLVWAPLANTVQVDIVDGVQGAPMEKQPGGYHQLTLEGVGPGSLYYYRVDGGPPRPDPVSRFQPRGVHGPSEVIDPQYAWQSDPPELHRDDLIIYELHLGTFTDEGTYEAAIDRLEELVELGVTAVELMPVAACAGNWNWGYDSVALFAPADAYGRPEDFRRFVDAAHELGLAVFLDVVYNHLGPEGNYLCDFGPYLSPKHGTVWGDAPNFDDPDVGDEVRRFFIANAVCWLDEYHLDGLRVDAIHCMADDRTPHIVADMSDAVRDWSRHQSRDVLLIAESNVYDSEMTLGQNQDGLGFDAMWCDDFLHSMFAALRPGEQLCDRPYQSGVDLAHVLQRGYLYEGSFGERPQRTVREKRIPTHDLVYSIQNHDFIGNHPLGVRFHQLASHDAHRAAAALLLLSPAIPMLFMGEEFASENPFCFFVDFGDDHLREAVVEGRRREYPQHDWDSGVLPTDPKAFQQAKIGPRSAGNSHTLRWYQSLIRLRKQFRESGLLSDENFAADVDTERGLYVIRYLREQQSLVLAARILPAQEATAQAATPIETTFSGTLLLDSRNEDASEFDGRLHANHAVVLRRDGKT